MTGRMAQIRRRPSVPVKVGSVWVGGSHPIRVQSMTNTDTADVAAYRNMLTMIRDRVKDLKGKGMTLAQVKAARPTMDFDGRYGSTTGSWTTDMFIDAVYATVK